VHSPSTSEVWTEVDADARRRRSNRRTEKRCLFILSKESKV